MLSINMLSSLMNAEQRLYDTLPTDTASNKATNRVSWASQGQGTLS